MNEQPIKVYSKTFEKILNEKWDDYTKDHTPNDINFKNIFSKINLFEKNSVDVHRLNNDYRCFTTNKLTMENYSCS